MIKDQNTEEMKKYKGVAEVAVDELTVLPDQVVKELEAHKDLYLTDPEKAHYWDPVVIGVPGGPVPCLLVEYTGRKSGKRLSMAIQYYRREGHVFIVASKGGTAEHPLWYLNLLENPNCTVHIASDKFEARARLATAEERTRWWPSIEEEQPMQKIYQSRTSREIPVVVLDRI